ncbi:MAG TPA: glycosyltransferase family 1 protein [Gemmatimonadales bacterium]|nr:glycosyltransferase family 1 protein [Gemmatimonadales bacterium]
MPTVLLVPDLPLEHLAAMDKYAHRLHDWLDSGEPGFTVRLAAHIGELTRDTGGDGRESGGFARWWNQPVDPSRLDLPGPLSVPFRYAARHLFYPTRLRREARRTDVVHILDHSYAHMLPRVRRRPVVVTVHDLMPVIVLRSPTGGWRERIQNRFLKTALKALRQADAFLVGTEWLRRELATWLGDDRKITVVPFGVDRAFFREAPGGRERGRSDWRIPEDAFVVLHVGSTVERKNVPLVIQTVARLRMEVGADVYLLQVGGRFTGDQEQLIDRLGVRRVVRSVPAADETTLRRAYRAADVLLFPSLYEGFGFPVLEAFASGLPVVASAAGGLREVAGDAGVIVESRDPTAYVDALVELSEDDDRRDALIAVGMHRAEGFTWKRTADLTAQLYRTFF